MKVIRRRHGAKRYTRKVLNESTDFSLGAGAVWKEPLWQYLTISTHADDSGEALTFEFNRAEAERVVKQFAEYLERDTRKPMMVNGSKGHA